jgi:hypothetical protein
MWSAYRLTAPLPAHLPGQLGKLMIPAGEVIEYTPIQDSGAAIAVIWRDRPMMIAESDLRDHAEFVKPQ